MSQRSILDVDESPALRRIAEEVRKTRSPVGLRVAGQVVAVLLPAPDRGPLAIEGSDDDAFFASLGGWKDLVDGERLKAEGAATRGSDRALVEL